MSWLDLTFQLLIRKHFISLLLIVPQKGVNEFRETSQTGRVIPAGATVFGVAVECLEIRRCHRHDASTEFISPVVHWGRSFTCLSDRDLIGCCSQAVCARGGRPVDGRSWRTAQPCELQLRAGRLHGAVHHREAQQAAGGVQTPNRPLHRPHHQFQRRAGEPTPKDQSDPVPVFFHPTSVP